MTIEGQGPGGDDDPGAVVGHGIDELRLHVRREARVVLHAVDPRAPLHLRGTLEVDDADVVLEAADHFLRLVGEAVALVLGEVLLQRMPRHQVVDADQDGQHHHDEDGGIAAVAELPAANGAVDLLPAQRDVEDDEGKPHEQVRVQVGLDRVPLPRGHAGRGHDEEPEGSEEVDESAHAQALHRWLSID